MIESKKNLIYITGFMGSGKSTITPILANTLGLNYVDFDAEIEKSTGKNISEIFSEFGENYFRDIERKFLQEISNLKGFVISLGGGTIANEFNLHLVKSSGILIYLKSSIEEIFNRLKSKTNRPLLQSSFSVNMDADDLRSRIAILLEQREPFYAQADLIIITSHKKIGSIVDDIVNRLRQLEKK